jgi:CHAT domain-containing protein
MQYLSINSTGKFYNCWVLDSDSAQIRALTFDSIASINNEIKKDYNEIVSTKPRKKTLDKIGRKIGKVFKKICKNLLIENEDNIALILDDKTCEVPWELAILKNKPRKYLGDISIGRMRILPNDRWVPTRSSRRRKALLVGLNYDDLTFPENEVNEISEILQEYDFKVTTLLGQKATKTNVKKQLKRKSYDVFHFTGHGNVEKNTGLVSLYDGSLSTSEIDELNVGAPNFVFVNACLTSVESTHKKSIFPSYTWAKAFLEYGSNIFIGTLWSIEDKTSSDFAKEYYRRILDDNSIGEAMKKARTKFKNANDGYYTSLAYVLYGNPSITLSEVLPKERVN